MCIDSFQNFMFVYLQFPLNAYTAPGYFAAITAAINVLSFIFFFKDVRVVAVQRKSVQSSISVKRN